MKNSTFSTVGPDFNIFPSRHLFTPMVLFFANESVALQQRRRWQSEPAEKKIWIYSTINQTPCC